MRRSNRGVLAGLLLRSDRYSRRRPSRHPRQQAAQRVPHRRGASTQPDSGVSANRLR